MMNYYNDNDPYVAQWLRNLVDAGLLPPGDVDERSITEVTADDVRGYEQCHFFAGIGGWPLALERAGWRGPAWTGSCPCQPLSSGDSEKAMPTNATSGPLFNALSPSAILGTYALENRLRSKGWKGVVVRCIG